jgi:hypothetical protein
LFKKNSSAKTNCFCKSNQWSYIADDLKLKLKQSPYEILQIMSVSMMDKTHLKELLGNTLYRDIKDKNPIQLKINLI